MRTPNSLRIDFAPSSVSTPFSFVNTGVLPRLHERVQLRRVSSFAPMALFAVEYMNDIEGRVRNDDVVIGRREDDALAMPGDILLPSVALTSDGLGIAERGSALVLMCVQVLRSKSRNAAVCMLQNRLMLQSDQLPARTSTKMTRRVL